MYTRFARTLNEAPHEHTRAGLLFHRRVSYRDAMAAACSGCASCIRCDACHPYLPVRSCGSRIARYVVLHSCAALASVASALRVPNASVWYWELVVQ